MCPAEGTARAGPGPATALNALLTVGQITTKCYLETAPCNEIAEYLALLFVYFNFKNIHPNKIKASAQKT